VSIGLFKTIKRYFTWPPLIGGRRRGGRLSEFPALFAQLREANLNLQQATGGLETQFLATGTELETLARFSDQFVGQVEKLVDLATGKDTDSSVFSSTIRLIEQSTDFLKGCQGQTNQMLELLRDYSAKVESLLGVEAELQHTMLPLRFVQTLFKSECAPLGLDIQQMFGSLTKEIEALHGQVRDIFGTKFKQLEQTQATIGRVIVQLEKQARSLQEVTTTNRARIESTLETLKKEMGSNQEREARLGRLSKNLAREVGQVVMGLQFQDIVSQKLQHVMVALPQIEAKFSEFEAASNTTGASEPAQFLHQSCRLKAGQLKSAQEELANAEVAIQDGIQKALGHLTEMDSECLSLEEFKTLTTSFDGMVQVLLETIEEVCNLVAVTVASAAEAYEMLKPLGSLASDLTAIVRGMSAQIHLIGLNAQIQAILAAEDRRGSGLVVLSARTSEISEETNGISEQAASHLDALVAGLAGSVKACEQLWTDGLAQQTLLKEKGRAEELKLHAFRDKALESLRTIGNLFDEIREQAQRTLATVQFTQFHQVTLPALRTPLVAIADTAERWLQTQSCGVAQASLIEGFKRDYTMASEREVFDGLVPANGSERPTLPGAVPVVGQDIEMFTDLPPDTDGKPPLQGEQEVKATAVAADAPSAGGKDQGGNVELF
jgi:hypothetical protein